MNHLLMKCRRSGLRIYPGIESGLLILFILFFLAVFVVVFGGPGCARGRGPSRIMKQPLPKKIDNSIPLNNAGDIKKALDSENVDFDRAGKLLDSLISNTPDDLSLLMLRARLLRSQGRNDESFAIMEDVLSKAPENADALAFKTEYLLDRFKNGEARKTVEKLMSLKPDDPGWRLLEARALTRLGEFDKAEKILKKLIKEDQGNIAYYIQLSDVYDSSLNIDKGIGIVKKALKRDWPDKSSESRLVVRMGEMLERQGKKKEAMETFKKALGVDPENLDARAKLALCMDSFSDPVSSWAEAEKAMEFESNSPYPLFAVARIYRNEGRFTLAMASLYKGIAKFPQVDTGYQLLGNFAFESKNYREALDAYDRLKILRPGDYNTLLGEALLAIISKDFKKADSILAAIKPPEHLKGDFYRKLGDAYMFHLRDYNKAEAYYNRSLEYLNADESEGLREGPVAALIGLGKIELLRGHDDKAEAYFQRAISKAPENFYVYTGIIRSCISGNKFKMAKKYINEWEQRNTLWAAKDRISAYLGFAELYLSGDIEESIKMAGEARKVDPEAPPYGKLLMVFKDEKNNARSYYERTVKVQPDDYMAWFYLGLLAEENGETDKSERYYKEAMKGLRYPGDLDYQKAWIYSVRKDKEKALQYLRKACNENVYNAAKAYSDEMFDWMRNDPFFKNELPEILKKVKDEKLQPENELIRDFGGNSR
ncbi:MAG: tetratricopeptide repeat protein [Chloroflexi bacterium]|nr:tetratricopeptide repeat protein [Chloroflexota bacterium]